MNPSFYLGTTHKSIAHSPYGGIAYNGNYKLNKNPQLNFNIDNIIPASNKKQQKIAKEIIDTPERSQYTLILKEGKYFIE